MSILNKTRSQGVDIHRSNRGIASSAVSTWSTEEHRCEFLTIGRDFHTLLQHAADSNVTNSKGRVDPFRRQQSIPREGARTPHIVDGPTAMDGTPWVGAGIDEMLVSHASKVFPVESGLCSAGSWW